MRICMLSVGIVLALVPGCVSASEEADDEENHATGYVPDTSTETPIGPRLPQYDEINAGDQPDHHPEPMSQMTFENPPNIPANYESPYMDDQYPDTDNIGEITELEQVNLDSNDNDYILRNDEKIEPAQSDQKFKYEEPVVPIRYDETSNSDEEYNDDNETSETETDSDEISVDDQESDDKNTLESIEDDYEESTGTSDDDGDTTLSATEKEPVVTEKVPEKITVTERITAEVNKKLKKPDPPKKRKPRRKSRDKALPVEKGPMTNTPPFPTPAGFTGYPASGNLGPGFTGHADPNALMQNKQYSAYPPSYQPPGYPAGYPSYTNPYPSSPYPASPYPASPYPASPYPASPYPASPYPTQSYPGYSPYQPAYPTSYSGYNPYPPYQDTANTRPQGSPSYPQDQITQADTKHTSHEIPGTQSSGPVPGRQGPAFPGQDYSAANYPGAAYPAPNYPSAGYPGYQTPTQTYPGYGGYTYGADQTGQYSQYRPNSGYPGPYRPPRQFRPKTLTQRAMSAVAEALTSIALFDDKQCVPRLLCEVACGSAASSPGLQKATEGLGPLLTVLQSYNGVSSSPLFLFGRAAVLGMTSRGNPTSCRYAYPDCPNDPEGLLDYLNNHNGGFFRFFGEPEGPPQQHNLEQFYERLSGQDPQLSIPPLQQQTILPQQQQTIPPQNPRQSYYGYPYGYGMQRPYGNVPHYGVNYYREQNTFRNAKEIDSETALSNIEERIQNRPGPDVLEEEQKEQGSKWAFPEDNNKKRENKPKRERKEKAVILNTAARPVTGERDEGITRGERGGGNTLKFPDERAPGPPNVQPEIERERDRTRQQNGFFFPNENKYDIQANYQTTTPVNLEEYVFDHEHNFYVKRPKALNTDASQTLYVVRGNGDPNHPEIVQVRPGQSA